MVLRSAGEVGCAHCKTIGADRSCQVCTRLVCATCAADWATCEEPSGRLVRLGMTARVRDIDPLGRYALVSHWRRPLRLFDLRALAWVAGVAWERRMYLMTRSSPPRLTASGELIFSDLSIIAGDAIFAGMHARSIETGRDRTLPRLPGDKPAHGTAVSTTGDVFYYVSEEQRVVVFPPDGAPRTYEPLPRKVIQAAAIDGDRKLMVSASWGEFVVHRFDDERGLVRLAHQKAATEGNAHWVGIAGEWVVVAISRIAPPTSSRDEGSYAIHYEAYRLHGGALGPLVHRLVAPAPFRAAAIARDGRYIAFAIADRLRLVDLDTGQSTDHDEHTDEINAIRFAREDHVLISADTDNRVILRPRNKTGYARPLLPVDIPAASN